MQKENNQLQAVRKVYEIYWDSYLQGDAEAFAATLDDTFEMIGTSETEVCHTKEDGIRFMKAQIQEVVGKVEMRNRQIDVVPVDGLMLVSEQCDIYVLIDQDWNFYSKLRISTLLKETDESWKVFQQHGSLPDMRVQKGETLAIDKISRENVELRDAVKRRTVELESKNRELEIEASLEKVRAQTMGMQSSVDLSNVASVMFDQMKQLGGDLFAFGIVLCDKDKDTVEQWHNLGNEGMISPFSVPVDLDYIHRYRYDQWKAGEKLFSIEIPEDYIAEHFKLMFDLPSVKATMDEIANQGIDVDVPEWEIDYGASFKHGYLLVSSRKPFKEDHIFPRFANVFEQAYTRFLDLQKAEAQAREAQIEAALEKVRSSSLAMQSSDQIRKIVKVVFEKLKELQFAIDGGVFVGIMSNDSDYLNLWIGDDHAEYPGSFIMPNHDAPTITDVWDAKKSGVEFVSKTYSFQEKNIWFEYAFNHTDFKNALPEDFKKWILEQEYLTQSFALQKNSMIGVHFHHAKTLTDNEIDILRRFSRVFEQSYVRFLDIQKAEAQTREVQIEAALEKVRSRSLAMHSTSELGEVVTVIVEKLTELGVVLDANGVVLCTYFQDSKDVLHWIVSPDFSMAGSYLLPYFDHSIFNDAWQSKETGDVYFSKAYSIEEKNSFFEYAFEHSDYRHFPDDFKQWVFQNDKHILSFAWQKNSAILIPSHTGVVPSADDVAILKRFAKVFEQSYVRFLDLQKAEAQARESQIQLALERVRARTMAMQHSEELAETSTEMFRQMQALGMRPWACGFNIFEKDEKAVTQWMSGGDGSLSNSFITPLIEDPFFIRIYEARQRREELFVMESRGHELEETYKYMFGLPAAKKALGDIMATGFEMPKFQISHCAFFSQGYLMFITYEPYPEAHEIFRRFAKVFEQTYTRFLDLQKAEAQAREAQIEAALERVRSRSMGMQHSNELTSTASLLFQQIQTLGVPPWSCGFNIWEQGDSVCSSYMGGGSENFILEGYKIPLTEEATFIHFQESRDREDKLFIDVLEGERLETHYRYFFTLPGIREVFEKAAQEGLPLPTFQINHLANFSHGNLMFITYEPCPEAHDIFIRFAKVFEQTYTRFLDLKKAEAQTREAIKRASVDRVRAEIASMRTTSDLERIQPLIWNELKTLDVPFIRCGVFIMDEAKQEVQVFLSTPDGNSIAAFRLPYYSTEQSIQIVNHWQRKQIFKDHMDEAAFTEYIKNLVQQGAVASDEKYVTENRPTDLYLHFLPFLQGMLYVGNDAPLKEDELQLVQNLADAFSTAYARYEDFNKLEQAKSEIESAMSELKATQSQLIQQEKLASLGQLTAGIAHEIKNPLNFVNNFSEVSIEMIEEIKEERAKSQESRDETLVDEILEDIQSNLGKIHEHGSRANGIVTSMLQHSRGGSGKKEPTDLNALIKEYVNLSFHGMRAGKNPIKVDIDLQLNKSIGEVPLIAEDFSRVILNLCNNAFDALREKQKSHLEGGKPIQNLSGEQGDDSSLSYQPRLTVRTHQTEKAVNIEIEDNGPGIPDEIKDKILQPFFTTKKGTEGTGLGLSITNDIIKAHGGSLSIKSDANGSIFTLALTNNS